MQWRNQMSRSRLMNHEKHLQYEISELESRLQPHDTGHIHTTIDVLKSRLVEIKTELDEGKIEEPEELEVNGVPV